MKLMIIFGPLAVGKMTVGHELEKITNLKLFHNHMTIELASNFFSFSTETGKRLVHNLRNEVFKEVASSNLEGLIFTYVWAFDRKEDWKYIEEVSRIFKDKGSEIYHVELDADIDERLRRNKTEHRLEHKPSKRDIAFSEEIFNDYTSRYRLNSLDGEIKEKNYLRIDNTNLDPVTVALQIKNKFNL